MRAATCCAIAIMTILVAIEPVSADEVVAIGFGTVWKDENPSPPRYSSDPDDLDFARLVVQKLTARGFAVFDLGDVSPVGLDSIALVFSYTKLPTGCDSVEIDSVGAITVPGDLEDFYDLLDDGKMIKHVDLPELSGTVRVKIVPKELVQLDDGFFLSWLWLPPQPCRGRGASPSTTDPTLMFYY